MTLVIDNYDSFTFNLVQLLGTMTRDIIVHRNDAVTVEQILADPPDRILISPGPGRPEDAGITLEVVQRCAKHVPILGVCLGHQAIGSAFGGDVVHAPTLMHGRTSPIVHHGDPLFRNIPAPFEATRYHSLVISRKNFPADLEITAETADGVIMGVRHRSLPVQGVQFHPESILTVHGRQLLSNWLEADA
jgi:anthranilate synthase/aminodeoxychorismate synthase-like glutamine amidotransferase